MAFVSCLENKEKRVLLCALAKSVAKLPVMENTLLGTVSFSTQPALAAQSTGLLAKPHHGEDLFLVNWL